MLLRPDITGVRRDVPVGVPLDLSMEWHELPKNNVIQVSQLIYTGVSNNSTENLKQQKSLDEYNYIAFIFMN